MTSINKEAFNLSATMHEIANAVPHCILALNECAKDLLAGEGNGTGLDRNTVNLAIGKGLMNSDTMSHGEAFAITEGMKTLDKKEFKGLRAVAGLN